MCTSTRSRAAGRPDAGRAGASRGLAPALALLALGFAPGASAAIYKCVDLDGAVSYARVPCAGDELDERLGDDGRRARADRAGRGAPPAASRPARPPGTGTARAAPLPGPSDGIVPNPRPIPAEPARRARSGRFDER